MKRNKIRSFFLVILTMFVVILGICCAAKAGQEDQLKAAFLYNFLKFVDWPAQKTSDVNAPVVIGLYGGSDIAGIFMPLKEKTVGNRPIVVKQFTCLNKNSSQDDLDKIIKEVEMCSTIFFVDCPDEARIKAIIEAIKGKAVLTIGQDAKFLEFGGNINFLIYENKLRFEVNLVSAKANNLQIRANLLKLAKRVIDEGGQ